MFNSYKIWILINMSESFNVEFLQQSRESQPKPKKLGLLVGQEVFGKYRIKLLKTLVGIYDAFLNNTESIRIETPGIISTQVRTLYLRDVKVSDSGDHLSVSITVCIQL